MNVTGDQQQVKENRMSTAELKQKVLDFIKGSGRPPRTVGVGPSEAQLGTAYNRHKCLSGHSYDAEFAREAANLLKEAGYKGRAEIVNEKKEKILAFVKANRCPPSTVSKDPEEASLGKCYQSYRSIRNGSYDPVFAEAVAELLQQNKGGDKV